MRTVKACSQEESGTSQGQEAEAPARLTTTLYDLMAVIQDVVGPDDTQVVRIVVYLLRSGQLTFPGKRRRIASGVPTIRITGARPGGGAGRAEG